MPFPYRCKNPPESFPGGTIGLILANVGIFAVTSSESVLRKDVLDAWAVSLDKPDPLHIVSAMFLHGSLMHLLGNMWFLYLFGFAVEGRLRTGKFLLLYLASGFTGTGLQLAFQAVSGHDVPNIGASGAIMGVMGAAMYIFPHAQVTMLWRYRSFEWPMWGVGLYYIGLDALFGALFRGADGVGHFAHIGGALGAILVAMAMRVPRDDAFTSDAKATLHDTKDLSLLSPIELQSLAAANPSDTTITLNWLFREIADGSPPSQECVETFKRQLPRMLQEEPIGPVAQAIASLSTTPGVIRPHEILDAATRTERLPDPALAARLYGLVLADPKASPQDVEAALFRTALIYENSFKLDQDAAKFYQRLVTQFPMGPFAEQAEMRLRALNSASPAPRA